MAAFMRLALPLSALLAVGRSSFIAPLTNLLSGACAVNYDNSTDLFPTKCQSGRQFTSTLSADYSLYWNVTYHGSYKIIRNSKPGHQVPVAVLYQCGTPKPDLGTGVSYWKVPVSKVAVTSTTYLPYVEILGEREAIKAYTSTFDYVSSPCFNKMHQENRAVSAKAGWSVNNTLLQELDVELTIADGWSASVFNAYPLTDTDESSVLKTAEYIELVALFFNREAEAAAAIATVVERYTCIQQRAQMLKAQAGTVRPKVLWAQWAWDGNANAGGWDVGKCPNYYCEVIAAAGGDVIEYPNVQGAVTLWGSYLYLSTAQLIANASDADFWLFPGATSFGSAAAQYGDVSAIKAVQNSAVYDVLGRGSKDWLESRVAMPDVFLKDVASILMPAELGQHNRVWLRHVANDAIGAKDPPSSCADTAAPLALMGSGCPSAWTVGTNLARRGGLAVLARAAGLLAAGVAARRAGL